VTKKVDLKIIKENIVEVPLDIAVKIENEKVIFEKGDVKQIVPYNHVYVSVEYKDNKLTIKPNNKKKPFLSVSNTIKKIINNAIEGFTKDFVCKMQIVYSHFPITVKIDGNKFIINNFYGEKKQRVVAISPGVKIEVDGKEITLSGKNKQTVGHVAGSIESKTKLKDKDYRVFDDGIYIVEKTK
jgi:large subunit ribosomal protein L6